MIIEKENECVVRKFECDYIFKYFNDSHEMKWEKNSYRMSEKMYSKVHNELSNIETIHEIIVFKNANAELIEDKEYIFNIINKMFKEYQFKGNIDTLYGRVLDNSSIEWGLQINENPPF